MARLRAWCALAGLLGQQRRHGLRRLAVDQFLQLLAGLEVGHAPGRPRPPVRPFLGLRPLRDSRRRRRKLPKPRSSTFSPRCSASTMLPSTVSTIISASFFREAGRVGHFHHERRLRQPAASHGFVCRQKGAVVTSRVRALPLGDNPRGSNDSSGKEGERAGHRRLRRRGGGNVSGPAKAPREGRQAARRPRRTICGADS